MYWPAATPRIYSTSTTRPPPSASSPSASPSPAVPAVTVSHDGLPPPASPSPLSESLTNARRPSFLDPGHSSAPLRSASSSSSSLAATASASASASNDALGVPGAAHAAHVPNSPLTPLTPAIKSVEHGYYAHDGAAGSPHSFSDTPVAVPIHEPILALRLSRSCHLFATITATSMTIWQAKPTVVLAVVVRSAPSLESYGENVDLLLRPDSAILVVYTRRGFLITYSLASDPNAQIYKPHFTSHTNVQRRRQNHAGDPGHALPDQFLWGPGEGGGIRDISVRFRMVIKVDAGIESALALDEELVVATTKPAAVQCIRWTPDTNGSQTSTELLSRMDWLAKKVAVREMTHDKPMSLATWVTSDGKAYAVQRNNTASSGSAPPATASSPQGAADGPLPPLSHPTSPPRAESGAAADTDTRPASPAPAPSGTPSSSSSSSSHKMLFRGHCFHSPKTDGEHAMRATINARFSLIAVGCVDGLVRVYSVKDYAGNVPASHTHTPPVSIVTSGRLTKMAYSPDGYCLFAGYEHGWATWSVYGKPLGHSFNGDRAMAETNGEEWLTGIRDVSWLGGAGEVLLVAQASPSIWLLEMARSAAAGCYSPANLFRTVLHTNQNIMVYRGYDLPDIKTISAEPSLWHTARIPANYLLNQWPIRCAVISSDGRYVAVAGRRGLAHYSVSSGRWRTFASDAMENEFSVRGGMCWHQNILVAAVEVNRAYELRLYSREALLDSSSTLHVERMQSPIVLITPSGDDSLLVYTYENILYHYIFVFAAGGVHLVRVGHIGFHGIVRSPARVRGLSWVLPASQLYGGDPSLDVAMASVLVLVDGKLVLFQPSRSDDGPQRYTMRIIAHSAEYYVCMKDQPFAFLPAAPAETDTADAVGPQPPPTAATSALDTDESLQNSLWLFDAGQLKLWTDTHDVLNAVLETGMPTQPIAVDIDYYPLSILMSKAIVHGVEPDLVQRRDVNFSFFRYSIRTHLFLPDVLRAYLENNKVVPAQQLARHYQHLEYFAHALEILLHHVLDEEVDSAPAPEAAVLPRVLSLLSSFRAYLDIVVQCTRKTEVRSWRTLFAYLPPPQELFEESLLRGSLKTAGGYLLILHTFDELATASEQGIRLLRQAMREGDWELCKELARFLAAMDDTGQTLRDALAQAKLTELPGGGGGNDNHDNDDDDDSDGTGSLVRRPAGSVSTIDEAMHSGDGSSDHLTVPRRGGRSSQSESDALSTSDDASSMESSAISGQ